jgi:uncharacterized protein (DUF302 family)
MPRGHSSSRNPRRPARKSAPVAMAFEMELPLASMTAIERITSALKAEGFGVITRIDAHTTFQEKLGLAFPPYTILGACNPELAHQALSLRPESGLLLPCNITIESAGPDRVTVRIQDPAALLALSGLGADPELQRLMKEARTRLIRVSDELKAHASTVAL